MYVAIAAKNRVQENARDRFFILTQQDVQNVIAPAYRTYMVGRKTPWHRPRNPSSFDARLDAQQLKEFENNWDLVRRQLETQTPPSLPLPLSPSP